MPLKASPSIDYDEGMEVQLGFSPEVRIWFAPASAGPSTGTDMLVPRFTSAGVSTSARGMGICRAGAYSVVKEEAAAVGRVVDLLQLLTLWVKGPRSQGPRTLGMLGYV